MTAQDVCKQLNILFQNDIKRKGLVKSGRLLKSINWIYDNGNFRLIAEEYFEYLDSKYNISSDVTNSPAFIKLIEDYYSKTIEIELNNTDNYIKD